MGFMTCKKLLNRLQGKSNLVSQVIKNRGIELQLIPRFNVKTSTEILFISLY